MFVKICGITREEDAQLAVELGASALGFVFWDRSPRFIEPHRVRSIVATLPSSVMTIGVFVNQPAAEMNAIADSAGVTGVQLHGDERPDDVMAWTRPVVKAFGVSGDFRPEWMDSWPARVLMLLDVHDPATRGGTGRTVDWTRAAAAARRRKVVLAGGLSPENVAAAIEQVAPFGIDVSSGVEARPGVKDHARLRALFEAIHASDSRPARS